jgi:hypothetical protein
MNKKPPTQGVVRTGRGEEQPADKDRAQQDSGTETHSTKQKPGQPAGNTPGSSGHS